MSRCWLCGFLLDSHNVSKLRVDGCNRCFPDYDKIKTNIWDDLIKIDDYDGGVKGVSKTNTPTIKLFGKPSTSIHHSKKNIGVFSLDDEVDKDLFIHNRLRSFHLDNKDVKPMKSKIKGVRFY